jgi:hypothetical protein
MTTVTEPELQIILDTHELSDNGFSPELLFNGLSLKKTKQNSKQLFVAKQQLKKKKKKEKNLYVYLFKKLSGLKCSSAL